MAIITPTTSHNVNSLTYLEWQAVGNADTLADAEVALGSYVPTMFGLHVTGTFAAATVALEGSLDGTSWFPLLDGAGDAAALIASGYLHLDARAVRHVRPVISGGGGTQALIVRFAAYRV